MTYSIGTPVYHGDMSNPDRTGFIASVDTPKNETFTLGAGGLEKNNFELVIVWDDYTYCTINDSIAARWLERAAQYKINPVSETKALDMLAVAKSKQAQEQARQAAKRDQKAAAVKEYRDQIRDKIPTNAKAVIVAEYRVDQSDSISDYYGSSTTKTIVLAFSTHTRDLFPEMRKAALNSDITAHLATAPDSAEHRQKYSMGGGYFLKDGSRHGTGWKISKERFYSNATDPAANVPFGEWCVPDPKAAPVSLAADPITSAGGFSISEHTHTKKGFQIWICEMLDRVERQEYLDLLAAARVLGGWYSRKWGSTPAGFAFKSLEAAQEFAGATDTPPDPAPKGSAPESPSMDHYSAKISGKLHDLAANMQSAIDDKYSDRLANTPKRRLQATQARQEGDRLKRTQQGLIGIAEHIDAGTLPDALAGVTTKKAAYDLAAEKIDCSNAGYYDAGISTGKPWGDNPTPAALEFWKLCKPKTDDEQAADVIRAKLNKIAQTKIAGYFPTPAAVVADMLDAAQIQDGDKILEPSAGSGAIMDAVKSAYPDNELWGYEWNAALFEILQLKGHLSLDENFLQSCPVGPTFQKVLMNPPFEKGQDIEHVQHAYKNHLIHGGRLVAITGPGWQFKQDKKSVEFREWLDTKNHRVRELPAGTFKESGTNVNSLMLIIGK